MDAVQEPSCTLFIRLVSFQLDLFRRGSQLIVPVAAKLPLCSVASYRKKVTNKNILRTRVYQLTTKLNLGTQQKIMFPGSCILPTCLFILTWDGGMELCFSSVWGGSYFECKSSQAQSPTSSVKRLWERFMRPWRATVKSRLIPILVSDQLCIIRYVMCLLSVSFHLVGTGKLFCCLSVTLFHNIEGTNAYE